jgi:endonuclease/exonuclease/phosphatase family metal-dependent hydrolase
VLTLNLAHGRARAWTQSRARKPSWYRDNLDVVARVLARERPDIVALQEAELGSRWSGMFDHVAYLAEKAELDVVAATPFVLVEGRWRYGTALLAKAEVLATGGGGFRDHGRWAKGWTHARLRLAGLELTAASLHLDHTSATIRARQVAELARALAGEPKPHVVAGDFNATWDAPTSAVRDLAARLGLAVHEPERRIPSTFPLLRRRLDWILVSPALEVVGHHVLVDDRLSDHRAVIADLRASPAA